MSYYMVKTKFQESSGADVDGFALYDGYSHHELDQAINIFIEDCGGEEYYYSDCNCVEDIDKDGFTVVELPKEEYDALLKHFGGTYGTPIPYDLFELY